MSACEACKEKACKEKAFIAQACDSMLRCIRGMESQGAPINTPERRSDILEIAKHHVLAGEDLELAGRVFGGLAEFVDALKKSVPA